MNDSPLMQVASDVYSNGNAWGDRLNSGHPMVKEFLRQATLYLWSVFRLDGFRFDDTKTILGNVGGWDFMGSIRLALRAAADALGEPWPYNVAENDDPVWNMNKPGWDVIDGEWHIDESYRVLDSSYDVVDNSDRVRALVEQMRVPQSWLRPYFDSVRFGESHDMVSGQGWRRERIAARPPFGQGYQMAKACGALVLLAKGVPMLFMGQESGETQLFSFDQNGLIVNPQNFTDPASERGRVFCWFKSLLGLRKDPAKGLRGDAGSMAMCIGRRTVAFRCGYDDSMVVVVTFGTPDQYQNTAWLGMPGNVTFNEIFNSSWPAFGMNGEPQCDNGGYLARIHSGDVVHLPYIGAVVSGTILLTHHRSGFWSTKTQGARIARTCALNSASRRVSSLLRLPRFALRSASRAHRLPRRFRRSPKAYDVASLPSREAKTARRVSTERDASATVACLSAARSNGSLKWPRADRPLQRLGTGIAKSRKQNSGRPKRFTAAKSPLGLIMDALVPRWRRYRDSRLSRG